MKNKGCSLRDRSVHVFKYHSQNKVRIHEMSSTIYYELCAWGRSFDKQLTVVVGGGEVDAVGWEELILSYFYQFVEGW